MLASELGQKYTTQNYPSQGTPICKLHGPSIKPRTWLLSIGIPLFSPYESPCDSLQSLMTLCNPLWPLNSFAIPMILCQLLTILVIPLWSLQSAVIPLQSLWSPCNPCNPMWPSMILCIPLWSPAVPNCLLAVFIKIHQICVHLQLFPIDLHFLHTFTQILAHICWSLCNTTWTGFLWNPQKFPTQTSKIHQNF